MTIPFDEQALRKVFKGDIEYDEQTLDTYSRDASLFEIRPQVVVFPKDSADVQALVRFVAELKKTNPTISLTARAAGTCMSGGPLNDSIIVDTTRYMRGICEVVSEESSRRVRSHAIVGHATVLPGTFYRDFDAATKQYNMMMPAYTASRELNTVGGMVGNNSGGEKGIQYGKTEEYIRQLKIVFRDGYEYTIRPLTRKEVIAKINGVGTEAQLYKELYQLITDNWDSISAARPNVQKNSAGYYVWNVWDPATEVFDLCRLIVGSQGTFGIITEITFDLVATKPHSVLTVVFLKDMKKLGSVITTALAQSPESVESYDDNTLKVATKFFGDFLRKKKVWGMIKFMFSFLPEFFMVLSGGFPKMVLLIEFAGSDESTIRNQATALAKEIKQSFGVLTHVTQSSTEEEKYWEVRHESFNLLRKHVQGKHTAPFIDDFVVRPELLPVFLPKLNAVLAEYDLEYTIAGHPGDGNFHIIPLMKLTDPRTREIILELSDRVYTLVLEYQGSITAEHNDGIIRSPYLEKQYGTEIVRLFGVVKHIFDPETLFNPHKKVGVTKADIERYLSRGDYGQASR